MPHAVRAMAKRGIDVSRHRSQPVDDVGLADFALLLVMEQGHRESLAWEFPLVRDRIYLLSEMVGGNYDVDDPVIGTLQDHVHTAEVIDQLLSEGFERIRELSRGQDTVDSA